MQYYEIAAKWWADELRNKEKANINSNNYERIKQFENSLAAHIKDLVEKKECVLLCYEDNLKNILNKVARVVGINIAHFPKNMRMFVRTYNVTVFSEHNGCCKTIFLEKE